MAELDHHLPPEVPLQLGHGAVLQQMVALLTPIMMGHLNMIANSSAVLVLRHLFMIL